jgi:hypothetical protein
VTNLLKSKENGLPLSSFRNNLKKIPRCFKGKDFVNWCLNTINITTREEALTLGQILMSKQYIISAIPKKEQTEDDFFFDEKSHYRYREITNATNIGFFNFFNFFL